MYGLTNPQTKEAARAGVGIKYNDRTPDCEGHMTDGRDEMDKIYREMGLGEIPWNVESPPEVLVDLVESGQMRPCRMVDLGCGAGNYAIYLAGKGFDVTGIDISPTAIRIAEENAKTKGVKCKFIAANLCGDLEEVTERFEFAFEWGLLHHILPEARVRYVENVNRMLEAGGKYLSMCFSEKDASFEGEGKYRETSLGTVLYFSSEEELKGLFGGYFEIKELRTIEVRGKTLSHTANYVFMEKRT